MNNLYISQDGTNDKITLSNLLVVGQTGSGRFNFINRYINDLARSYMPDQLRIILVDTKAVLFDHYKDLPHLLFGIVSKNDDLHKALDWVCRETNTRLEIEEKRTAVVIIIDEVADLVIKDSQYIENVVEKITKCSDQTDIYLVLSTARTDEVILSDKILSCFSNRLAFSVNNANGSVLVIGESGAEDLKAPGTCILKNFKTGEIEKIKIPYINEEIIL